MISLIYAHRNRDIQRIQVSLDSLKRQINKEFEVIFVDFGSQKKLAAELHELIESYDFVRLQSLDVSQLLWNKSKALNYGILHAQFHYIFIADVDLVFHPQVTQVLSNLASKDKFFLFSLGYLNSLESEKLNNNYQFEDLSPSRFGEVNGMMLAPTKAFLEIKGFDEFFHFYGSEDEDLFTRMESAGYKKNKNGLPYFYHKWHKSFAGTNDIKITRNPRIKNAMRINQQHFFRNRDRGIIQPIGQSQMGTVIDTKRSKLLKNPTKSISIYNIIAQVEHFLGEELPTYSGEIIQVEFIEDPYFNTLKYRLKKLLGRQTQHYCSLKDVNDKVLKEIIFRYRDANYSFIISEDLKRITFVLDQQDRNFQKISNVP